MVQSSFNTFSCNLFRLNFLRTAEKFTNRETPTGIFIKTEIIQKSPG